MSTLGNAGFSMPDLGIPSFGDGMGSGDKRVISSEIGTRPVASANERGESEEDKA